MRSDTEISRELRGWLKLIQNAEGAKKVEAFTSTLSGLTSALSSVNREMKEFNQNTSKSNKFLGKIARLQESMESQTRAANRVAWLVVGLAVLQVVLTVRTDLAVLLSNAYWWLDKVFSWLALFVLFVLFFLKWRNPLLQKIGSLTPKGSWPAWRTRLCLSLKEIALDIFSGIDIRLPPVKKTILLPAISIPVILFGLSFLFHAPIRPGAELYDEPIKWLAIKGVFLAPLIEETIFRGIALGGLLALVNFASRKFRFSTQVHYVYLFSALVLQAQFFAQGHPGIAFFPFVMGFVYGLFYIFSRRNLLPAIVAHTANNLVVWALAWPFW